jgi:hypothetical protein
MTTAVAVYSSLMLIGILAILVTVAGYVRDQWRHRAEDGERLAVRLSGRQTDRPGSTALAGPRMRLDVDVALTAYGIAFVGDLIVRTALVGWHLADTAWWAIPDALVAAAVHTLLDRHARPGLRALPFVRSGGLAYVVAITLGLLGGFTALA